MKGVIHSQLLLPILCSVFVLHVISVFGLNNEPVFRYSLCLNDSKIKLRWSSDSSHEGAKWFNRTRSIDNCSKIDILNVSGVHSGCHTLLETKTDGKVCNRFCMEYNGDNGNVSLTYKANNIACESVYRAMLNVTSKQLKYTIAPEASHLLSPNCSKNKNGNTTKMTCTITISAHMITQHSIKLFNIDLSDYEDFPTSDESAAIDKEGWNLAYVVIASTTIIVFFIVIMLHLKPWHFCSPTDNTRSRDQ
jgi:hypothetical protein